MQTTQRRRRRVVLLADTVTRTWLPYLALAFDLFCNVRSFFARKEVNEGHYASERTLPRALFARFSRVFVCKCRTTKFRERMCTFVRTCEGTPPSLWSGKGVSVSSVCTRGQREHAPNSEREAHWMKSPTTFARDVAAANAHILLARIG